MKIALIGTGAMGRIVSKLAEGRGHEIAISIDLESSGAAAYELAEKLNGVDAAIDFSHADAVPRNVEACVLAGVPLVEGTTGWMSDREKLAQFVRDRNGAVVYAANFSLSVNLFYRITQFASELLAKFPEYETFIEEQHHSRKKDAPSGTAVKLKEIVAAHYDREFTVTSTRAGNIPGTHSVGFDGPADQIMLKHTARSREGFAHGAILAAEWIVGKKGFYEFTGVIDEISLR